MAKADIVIREKAYALACAPGRESRLVALSKKLDARVRTIEQAVGDVGETRLFLLAALALLDELDAARSAVPTPTESEARAAAALNDAAARIEAIVARAEARL